MTDQQTLEPPAPPEAPGPGSPAPLARRRLPRPELLGGLRRQARSSSPSSTPSACTASSRPLAVQSWAIVAFLVLALVASTGSTSRRRDAARQVPGPRACSSCSSTSCSSWPTRATWRSPTTATGTTPTKADAIEADLDPERDAASRARRRCPLTVVQRDGELGFAIVAGRRRRRSARPSEPLAARRRRHGRGRPASPPSPAGRCSGSPQIAEQQDGDHRAARPVLRRPERRVGCARRTARPATSTSRRSCTTRRPTPSPTRRPATTYTPSDSGNFVSEDGDVAHARAGASASASTTSRASSPTPGWPARSSQITVWTFAFAFLSVRHHVRARAVPRDRVQRPAGPRPQDLPVAADPPVRVPGVPVRAGLAGHAQPAVRVHQRGPARRRRHPVADRPVAGQAVDPGRQPLARLPVHVPRLHRRAAGDPGGHHRGRAGSTAPGRGGSSGP